METQLGASYHWMTNEELRRMAISWGIPATRMASLDRQSLIRFLTRQRWAYMEGTDTKEGTG